MTAYVISEALIAYYRFVFGTAEGQRVLEDILGKASVFTPIAHVDAKECDRMEGARQLALYIAGFDSFDYGRYKKLWPQTKPKENDDV